MSLSQIRIAVPAALVVMLALCPVAAVRADPDLSPILTIPQVPVRPAGPDRPIFGIDGPQTAPPPGTSGGANASPGEPAKPAGVPASRQDMLDRLFDRLAKATDADEANGIAGLIQHVWMHSGSDTADLLMARAVEAMGSDHADVARSLLDKLVVIEPGWAEAWNKRATLRFLGNDDAGSMEDISHALSIEPRHFGALSGLGFILKRNGLEKGALTALRKAQQIYPENPDINKAVDDLVPEVEGRDL